MTWVNAAGDSGGADCLSGTSTNGAGLAVDSPADVPEVTGIGGTTFREGSGQYWNATNNANGGSATLLHSRDRLERQHARRSGAGGGGASTVFAQPSWQTGLGVPNNGARNVPDIALAASAGSRWVPGLHRRPARRLRRNLRRHACLRRNRRPAQSLSGVHRRADRSRRRQHQSAPLRPRPGRTPASFTMSPPATTSST